MQLAALVMRPAKPPVGPAGSRTSGQDRPHYEREARVFVSAGALGAGRVVEAAGGKRGSGNTGAGYEPPGFQAGFRYRDRSGQKAETDAARAEVQGTRAAMLGPGSIVVIAIRCRVGGVALAHEMHRVLQNLAHAGNESPEKQQGDSHGNHAIH